MNTIMAIKIEDAKERKLRIDTTPQISLKKLGDFTNKTFKNLVQSADEKFRADVRDHQNLIFNELSRFVNFFVNICLPYEQAYQLLTEACDFFQLDKNKTHTLTTELR